ncbi:hypothetical protein [Bacillus thuringiensis]|uniref:Uncharacterized protein n=1 Tax=Bacillus thuringiensis TaxID=1428 RepID=A0A9X6WHY8_BACTU|nr:hypothetical protein [Bacillus thuringiensis]PFJ31902.1 hypothetical protein COJ15_29825 [Bacillus thuringiensis]
MYINFATRISWVRKLQRELKKKKFSLTYKQDDHHFNVYFNELKSGNSLKVEYDFGEAKLPSIKFSIPSARLELISLKRKMAMDTVLDSFKDMIKERHGENLQISFYFQTWNVSEEDMTILKEWMKERQFAPIYPGNEKMYMHVDVQEKVTKLYNVNKEIVKKFKEDYYDKENPLIRFLNQESFPYQVTYNFQETVDREATVVWRHNENDFRINFRSPYHSKELIVGEFTYQMFVDEYEQFVAEDKFKELVNDPKMNKSIQGRLERIGQDLLYPRVGTKELFDFFMGHYSVEELTELSIGKSDVKVLSKTDYADSFDVGKERIRKTYYLQIIQCFGKCLRYESINISTEEEKQRQFTLCDSFEEARKDQKEWLIKQM